MGYVYKGYDSVGGDRRRFDDVATYQLWVMNRGYPWAIVHAMLLEFYKDKQNRWCLQDYLWSNEPTRAQFVVARPYLMKMWLTLKESEVR